MARTTRQRSGTRSVRRAPAGAATGPRRAGRGRELSELESFTLGLVWQFGPCSPYEIRRHMKGSPSTQWSASAGAIYPLMRRLEKRGLVGSRSARTGRRARREYTISSAGEEALRRWIGPPLPAEAVSVTYDPLRSRARFLGAATPSQRRAWLKEAEAALEAVGRMVAQWQEEYGKNDAVLGLVTRNGELETAARRTWIREMSARLG